VEAPKAAVVSVGTELLTGERVNRDLAYLGGVLFSLGVEVRIEMSVPDRRELIVRAVGRAVEEAEIVLVTGGLGPTPDDLTREAVAGALGLPVESDPRARELVLEAARREGVEPTPEWVERQSLQPRGAFALGNRAGTAPGFILEHRGQVVVALPGPPRELEAMVEDHVRPFLQRWLSARGGSFHSLGLRVIRRREWELAALVEELGLPPGVEVAYLPRLGEVEVRLRGRDRETVEGFGRRISRALGHLVYGEGEVSLEARVGELLRERGWTLALAESCTGGLLGHRITSVPGSSDYFLFGAVVYANRAKVEVLGVREETLRSHGAVSEETAREMAEGALRVGRADMAVSTTGIAGPGGGVPGKPVGTVCFGLATRGEETRTFRCLFPGDREAVKYLASQEALCLLYERLAAPESLRR
jgi:nicotinamide-nucleotide amidase